MGSRVLMGREARTHFTVESVGGRVAARLQLYVRGAQRHTCDVVHGPCGRRHRHRRQRRSAARTPRLLCAPAPSVPYVQE